MLGGERAVLQALMFDGLSRCLMMALAPPKQASAGQPEAEMMTHSWNPVAASDALLTAQGGRA